MKKNQIIKNALISVYDKSGIIKLAKNLILRNIDIFSTGGTYKILIQAGIKCTKISDYTGFSEMMHGKIKTLHPKIHGGILATEKDKDMIKEYQLIKMDMVVVNFYPFQNLIEQNKNDILNNIMKYIDIGGPAMVRSAAKNYENVVVIVKPSDYAFIIKEMDCHQNKCTIETKLNLSILAFQYTSNYDSAIIEFLLLYQKKFSCHPIKSHFFPKTINLFFKKKQDLRYGENKHQKSAFYVDCNTSKGFVSHAIQTQGKLLSYNNILDSETALECVKEFLEPSCVIVKHGNPCNVATKNNILEAYLFAYNSDPISAFGGVIAFNCTLDKNTAKKIIDNQFVEVIVVPDATEDALKIMSSKKNVRVLLSGKWENNIYNMEYKSIKGGLLVQDIDQCMIQTNKWNVVTKRHPSQQELNDANFSWKIVKYVKSNAIVCAYNHTTISIGAGQMSRVYATKVANMKFIDKNLNIKDITMASDAFFPFCDSIDIAAKMGISCVIQPGGSIHDLEAINSANKYNMTMIFTGNRHFRH